MKRYATTVNGVAYDVTVDETGAAPAPVAAAPAAPAAAPAPVAAPAGGTQVSSPMPGSILDVKVNVGDAVSNGQVLVLLEAMKMENEICAPCGGKVVSVAVKKGDTVDTGSLMVVIG